MGRARLMAGFAGIANLLPTSMVTGVARSQAARMDFATSNLRGARVPLYISSAEVEANYPFGPLAGTASRAIGDVAPRARRRLAFVRRQRTVAPPHLDRVLGHGERTAFETDRAGLQR